MKIEIFDFWLVEFEVQIFDCIFAMTISNQTFSFQSQLLSKNDHFNSLWNSWSLCRTRLRPLIGLKVVYFMMFISLIALVVKISVLDRKFFLEVNQVKLTFSRGQSPRVSPLLITLTLARSPRSPREAKLENWNHQLVIGRVMDRF